MKVKIQANGNMIVQSETELETYALEAWKEKKEITVIAEVGLDTCGGLINET